MAGPLTPTLTAAEAFFGSPWIWLLVVALGVWWMAIGRIGLWVGEAAARRFPILRDPKARVLQKAERVVQRWRDG